MWNHPIVQREFLGTLRRRRAAAAIIATAVAFSALVLLGWPSDAQVDLSGVRRRKSSGCSATACWPPCCC